MKYINQLEHRDIPYEHNLDHGGVPEEKRNVAAAGCGPSCLCMMVDALTLSTYELTDCLKLSNEVGANREIGTSLKILGPVVAERFNLNYGETSDLNELKAHLAKADSPSQIPAETGKGIPGCSLMEDITSSLYRPMTMRRAFWIRPIKKENMRSRAGMEKRES